MLKLPEFLCGPNTVQELTRRNANRLVELDSRRSDELQESGATLPLNPPVGEIASEYKYTALIGLNHVYCYTVHISGRYSGYFIVKLIDKPGHFVLGEDNDFEKTVYIQQLNYLPAALGVVHEALEFIQAEFVSKGYTRVALHIPEELASTTVKYRQGVADWKDCWAAASVDTESYQLCALFANAFGFTTSKLVRDFPEEGINSVYMEKRF